MYISKLYPDAPLLGIGFSLGANVLTRYLAQEGEQSRLAAGCVLGCVSRTPDARSTHFAEFAPTDSHGTSSRIAKGLLALYPSFRSTRL